MCSLVLAAAARAWPNVLRRSADEPIADPFDPCPGINDYCLLDDVPGRLEQVVHFRKLRNAQVTVPALGRKVE